MNESEKDILNIKNQTHIDISTATIVLITFFVLIGSEGNVLVLIVFGTKLPKPSSYRLFVLAMACFDITGCSLGMPGLIVEMFYSYTFYSSFGCKILRYSYFTIASGTAATHMLMGIDRYRRICQPLATQITSLAAKRLLVVIFIFALTNAIPAAIIYDSESVKLNNGTITGYQCGKTKDYSETNIPVAYDCFLLVLLLTTATTLVVCYSLIGKELYFRSKFLSTLHKRVMFTDDTRVGQTTKTKARRGSMFIGKIIRTNSIRPESNAIEEDFKSAPEVKNETKEATTEQIEREAFSDIATPISTIEIPDNTGDGVNGVKPKQNQLHRSASRENNSRKITAVTFTLTVTFIVSFFPYIMCDIIAICLPQWIANLSYTQDAVLHVVRYLYTLNNVVNPLIYLFMDKEFKKHVKLILQDVRDKCRRH